MSEVKKASRWETILNILVVVLPYLCFFNVLLDLPIVESPSWLVSVSGFFGKRYLGISRWAWLCFVLVTVLQMISVVRRYRCTQSSRVFLFWNMMTKLCYIPFFLLTFALATVSTFLPGVVLLVGPVIFLLDAAFMIPPLVSGLLGSIRLLQERKDKHVWIVVLAVCHFVFVLDVPASIVLYVWSRKSDNV